MTRPAHGERRITRTPAGYLSKVEYRLQEYRRGRLWGGSWVTLFSDFGYSDIKGSDESARSRVESKKHNAFDTDSEVVWSSTDGLPQSVEVTGRAVELRGRHDGVVMIVFSVAALIAGLVLP